MTGFSDHEAQDAAAEYALGTASPEERAAVAAARAADPALDAAVAAWDRRLAPLLHLGDDAAPSPDVFAKIEDRLFGARPQTAARPELARSLRFWRALAVTATMAWLLTFGFVFYGRMPGQPEHLAILQQDAGAPAFVARLDERHGRLVIQALAHAAPPAGKSYEVWLIPDAAPTARSLGILSPQPATRLALPKLDPALLRNATLAISLEPLGGSPTGVHTGPILFVGKFAPADL